MVYASRTGRTGRAAEYIARRLGADVIDLRAEGDPDLSGYDTVVIGSGVYAGRPSKKVSGFVERNGEALSRTHAHLFLTCRFRDGKADGQLDRITSGMPFLRSKAYFNGIRDGPDERMDAFADGVASYGRMP